MTIQMPRPQAQQSLDTRDYEHVVCVAGTRYWNDRRYFHEKIVEFIEVIPGDILFVSGAAFSGADDLIIRWCQKFRYPCLKMPADWNNEKNQPNFNIKAQGFIRNEKMAEISNYLLAFWDNHSTGTGHMVKICETKGIPMQLIIIPHQEKVNHG